MCVRYVLSLVLGHGLPPGRPVARGFHEVVHLVVHPVHPVVLGGVHLRQRGASALAAQVLCGHSPGKPGKRSEQTT